MRARSGVGVRAAAVAQSVGAQCGGERGVSRTMLCATGAMCLAEDRDVRVPAGYRITKVVSMRRGSTVVGTDSGVIVTSTAKGDACT